jgi:hypothetical protein
MNLTYFRLILVMGNPVWDRGPLLEVAVHIMAETVTQPYFQCWH